MESSATQLAVFSEETVSGVGVVRSANIPVGPRQQASFVLEPLGDIAAAIVIEVSNSTDEQVQAGTDLWTHDDSVSIDSIAPAALTVDTDDLVFRRFTDGSPDLTAAAATAAPLPACTAAGSGVGKTLTANAVGILTVDGVHIVLNDVVLVKNQANPADNGLYKCTTAGTAGVAFVLTRSTSFDAGAEVTTGKTISVAAGDGQSGVWVLAYPAFGVKFKPGFRMYRVRLGVTAGSGVLNADGYVRGV